MFLLGQWLCHSRWINLAIEAVCRELDSCLRFLPLFLPQGKPVEILPFLYLGSAYHASRQDYLSDLHITALLNVSRRDLQPAKGHYDYKWIPVEDSHMADISSHFQEAIDFIGELRRVNAFNC